MSEIKLEMSGQLSFSDDITIAQAAAIISFLHSPDSVLGGSSAIGTRSPSVGPVSPSAVSSAGVASPREAIDVTGARTNPEKIVALAAYILQDGELDTFSLDQIRPQFQRAREPMPKNLSRDLDTAIVAGWVDTGAKGQLYLTSKAAGVLEEGFEAIRAKRASAGSKARGTGKPSRRLPLQRPGLFDDVDEFPTEIEGVPSYHQIATKRDKVLWASLAAKQAGFELLNHKELSWLTEHFGDTVLVNHIGVNFALLQKAGLMNKTTDGRMRIKPAGESYLRSLAGNKD